MEPISPDTVAKFNELISWVMDSVKEGGTFIASEIPLVVQQLLRYEFYIHLSYSLCGVFILLCLLMMIPFVIRACKKHHDDMFGEGLVFPFVLIAILLLISGIGILTDHAPTVLKIKLAPKVFVLEKCQRILKGY